ncbi:MAG TPA: PAS domain S-box protein [Planctomycetota bacterium]|jgi:PAS domain S-box-containing protein
MPDHRTQDEFPRAIPAELVIAGIYAFVATLWIYGSDSFLAAISPSTEFYARWSTYKGWCFVAVTSTILFAVLRGMFRRIRTVQRELEGDVAARKHAEQMLEQRNAELKAERARWQGVVESIADEVWVADLKGRMSLINLPEVTHMGLAEFHDKSVEQILEEVEICNPDGNVRPAEDAPLLRALRGEIVRGEESMRHRKTGRLRFRQFSAAPTRDPTGAITGAVAIVRDVTEHKQAEQALRESEQRLRAIFDGAALGIAEMDRESRFVAVNERMCEMLGYCRGDLLGRTVHEITAPEDRARSEELNGKLRRGEVDRFDYEKRYLRMDGSSLWVHVTCSAVRDAAGNFVRAVGTIEDIEERKRAGAQRRLQVAALNAAANGIVITDATGTILWVNQAFSEMTGYDAKEVIGQNPRILKSGKQEQKFYEDLWAVLRRGEVWRGELINRRKDGSFYHEEMTITPVPDEQGHNSYYVGIKQDISGRKRAEEADREASRRKDEFLAMLGHELRNPLAPIRNAVHIMKRAGPAEPAVMRAREMIDRQVTHLARLVDDLLDVSRISRGKISLKKQPLDLTALVREFARDYASLCESAGVALQLNVPDHPLWTRGDPARIQQIIGNLLSNAAKFTNSGGIISLSLNAEENDAAQITVQDSGIGMDESTLSCIFEPFSQAEHSIDRSRGGLGLGLALVKGLVALHGGTVRGASAGLGKGSIFNVVLPLEKDCTPISPQAAKQIASHAHRILIIEDNADAAESLRMLLAVLGHNVACAASGAAGLERARDFQPDVVLCDIGLPGGMDGYDVARAIRADREMASTYLIALTGYGQEDDRRKAREAGFDHHLTKPADPDSLERLLAT